jgi:hypothetical protein
MPFASVLHDRFVELLADGGDQQDWSAIGRMLLKDESPPVEATPAELAHA